MRRTAVIILVVLGTGWAQTVAAGPPLDEAFFTSALADPSAPKEVRDAFAAFAAGRSDAGRAGLRAFVEAQPDHALAPRAGFVLAWYEAAAGEHRSAAEHFERAGNRFALLQDHAYWLGAESAYAAGDHDRTIRLCRAIPASSSFGAPSTVLRARALMAKGDLAAAIELFGGVAKAHPNSAEGRDAGLYMGAALELKGQHAAATRAFHAVTVKDAGTWRERVAQQGLARVERKLSKAERAALGKRTGRERIQRLTGLNVKHRSEQVLEEVGEWLESKAAPRVGSPDWCDAKFVQGAARRKLREHTNAARSFGAFLDACKRHPDTVTALFSGARSAWTAHDDARALRWFTRVWKEFPAHSFADDSLVYAARIHEEAGRDGASRKLLAFQIQHFSKGDMLADAHWYLFRREYAAGRYARAVAYADKVKRPGEDSLYTRGRLSYFRARALEQTGRRKLAVAGFVALLDEAPMSYYALLGLGRLEKLDEAAYDKAVLRLSDTKPKAVVWHIEPADLAQDPYFLRGVELLRLGLEGEARAEFDRLRARRRGDDRVLWTLTVLFDRVGAYQHSHDIPRREIDGFGQAWPIGTQRGRYELAYPRPFHDDVKRWSAARGIPEALVYAIMREESGFNPQIESWAGAVGLMQLMVPTAQGVSKEAGVSRVAKADLLRSGTNIQLGTQFLANLMAGYGDHPAVTIAGYNGGFGNVDRWLSERGKLPLDLWVEEIPYGQTRHYTKRVLTTMWTYRWLYGAADERILTLSQKLPAPANR